MTSPKPPAAQPQADAQPPHKPGRKFSTKSLVAILVVAAIVIAGGVAGIIALTGNNSAADSPSSAATSASAQSSPAATVPSLRLVAAAGTCGLARYDQPGFTFSDDAQTVAIAIPTAAAAATAEAGTTGSMDQVTCLLQAVDAPDDVVTQVSSAADSGGEQQSSWDHSYGSITFTWSYKTDSGLEANLAFVEK